VVHTKNKTFFAVSAKNPVRYIAQMQTDWRSLREAFFQNNENDSIFNDDVKTRESYVEF
jgi:hypothetical protein